MTVLLEDLPLPDLLATLVANDADAALAAAEAVPALAGLVQRAERAIRSGGRVVYVGAGTSGRLAAGEAA